MNVSQIDEDYQMIDAHLDEVLITTIDLLKQTSNETRMTSYYFMFYVRLNYRCGLL